MTMDTMTIWTTLAALGAFHGLNPAMGWLFAVALGLQERRRAAVLRAFCPIAAGHALSVVMVLALVGLLAVWVDLAALRLFSAVGLVTFGVYKLVAPLSHPRWVGMRVGGRELATWSFLMSTAHGAGLMLAPLLLRAPVNRAAASDHAAHLDTAQVAATVSGGPGLDDLFAVALHTAAMFVVMAIVALLVYEKLGLRVLRRGWLNVDRVWAGALIGAGWLTLTS
jgi:hypothetical protein